MTIIKIHIKILSEIFDTRQKFYQKFLTWLVFKIFETVTIFQNHFVNCDYFFKILFFFVAFLTNYKNI